MDDSEYEASLSRIHTSGPHDLDDDKRALNRAVYEEIRDILPIDDIHKVSDADLIYRFLIAYRWHPQKSADAIRDYVEWRSAMNLNTVLWEEFPDEVNAISPRFHGVDRFGNPVFYDRPSPAVIGRLLAHVPRETLLRTHFAMMERGRRLCKAIGADRVTCIVDLANLNMSIVTNPSAVGLLKEFSHLDQKFYPENMRTMILQNAGWTFSTLYKVIRPLLDVRVQKKIQIVRTGDAMVTDMEPWVDMSQVLEEFGGSSSIGDEHACLVVQHLEPGTPPLVGRDHCVGDSAAAAHSENLTPSGASLPTVSPPPPTAPTPPPSPEVKRKVTQFFTHRSLGPDGYETSTAFVLGWPVAQRCEKSIFDGTGTVKASVLTSTDGSLLIVDDARMVRYKVSVAPFGGVRKVKVRVHRPSQPGATVVTALTGELRCSCDTFLAMDVVPGNEFDHRDWTSFSHTRGDVALMMRRANHVAFQHELLSVPIPVLFALATAICSVWPWPTTL
jgi:hypothetical protein